MLVPDEYIIPNVKGRGIICLYCGTKAVLCHSTLVYKSKRYNPIWVCPNTKCEIVM